MSHTTNVYKRGDKTAKNLSFVVDAIKDGKLVEEWLFYDKATVAEIFK
jgi:hypothetical protein